MCQWTSFKFSAIKLFSQSFGELTRCSQNMPCGQCEVSKRLAYRHILKSIVKKLEEKNQKLSFFGTWINFYQVCSSHAICRAAHPWLLGGGRGRSKILHRDVDHLFCQIFPEKLREIIIYRATLTKPRTFTFFFFKLRSNTALLKISSYRVTSDRSQRWNRNSWNQIRLWVISYLQICNWLPW